MLMDKNIKQSKAGILFLLLIQNTGLALAVKASKNTNSGYIPTTVVFLNEFVKLLISIAGFYRENPTLTKRGPQNLIRTIFEIENLKFAVPCLIYAVQNNLIFIVLHYIDAALYQVYP
jgi:UDP-sugar transporter A1/2/3